MKTLREKLQLNGKEGISQKGAWTPLITATTPKQPPERGSQGVKSLQQSPFLNPDPFQYWHGVKNVARVRINGESCMALLENGLQINK